MNLKNIIKEEIEDFEWIKSVKEDLIPGHSYYINSSDGIYWSPETFVGKEWDDLYGMEVYKFKDIGSDHSKHRMSADYVQTLIKQGKIKPYDPEWTILDEINFSEKGDNEKYILSGFSFQETWGRWLDGNVASLYYFSENFLPNEFEIELFGRGYFPNSEHIVILEVYSNEKLVKKIKILPGTAVI